MEDLVLSIEQCKHLQELGLDMSDAKMCHLYFTSQNGDKFARIYFTEDVCEADEFTYTYTLQEIWRILPENIESGLGTYTLNSNKDRIYYYISKIKPNCYSNSLKAPDFLLVEFSRISILYSAYEMLCWVMENGYLKTK